jgi:predicted nucleic acid-binding protein
MAPIDQSSPAISLVPPETGLVPPETVERLLLSSTARFTGEYTSEGIAFTHAWPGFYDPAGGARFNAGPFSRNAFVLSFAVPEVPRVAGQMIPRYEPTGETICSLLSLLYGKRFDAHGAIQHHGGFFLPHLEQFNRPSMVALPQNDHRQRTDIPVPLELRQIAKIRPLLFQQYNDQEKAFALFGAAKFYWQALQTAERDAEVAYLHLITAGEILASAHRSESADQLDEEVRAVLDKVKQHVPCGEKAVRILANRMRGIKRRFRSTVEDLLDDDFFAANPESVLGKFGKDRNSLSKLVSAAYDIRSQYVHSGHAFGGWIAPRGDCSEEIRHGMPEDVKAAPTYVGLERVIRYCLVRFAGRHQLLVDVAFDQ